LQNNYANVFTLITRMRQIADHPDLVLRKDAAEGQNTIVCSVCDDEAEDPIKAKCRHTFCRDCAQRYITGYDGHSAPDCPKCHVPLALDLTQPAIEAIDVKKNSIVSRIDMSKWRSSTKIEALCEELHKLRKPNQSTKSIVFSQFTSMLQLIEWRLNRAGFKTVMLEGSMTPAQRDATIQHFMKTVDVDVFLVSLRAGGVALNLIEASQVFLMEPWWNPSVEWQVCDILPFHPPCWHWLMLRTGCRSYSSYRPIPRLPRHPLDHPGQHREPYRRVAGQEGQHDRCYRECGLVGDEQTYYCRYAVLIPELDIAILFRTHARYIT
jgi:hypothetical protein